MNDDPTFATVGEENVRQMLRRRMESRMTDRSNDRPQCLTFAEIRVPVIDLTGENA